MDAVSPHQVAVRATYMRGGTSKGVFFLTDELPEAVRSPGHARDRFLLRVLGSPDPYERQIDGMGAATSSTSKVVLLAKSERPNCDVDFLFGAVSIDQPIVDWSGNCGNLSAAVGPFAITRGLVAAPADGWATVRIWQANIGKRIVAHVPMAGGQVAEDGDFELDGVAFPAAEIRLEFIDPAGGDGEKRGALFPTGSAQDVLDIPGIGQIEATLIDAGNPTVFVNAEAVGLTGCELQADVNDHPDLLYRLEAIRAHAAVAMGLAPSAAEATALRPATPKIAFVSAPTTYVTSNGRTVAAAEIDILVRIVSMGKLHHALTGTGAVAVAAAAATPGTLLMRCVRRSGDATIRIGHPSGRLPVCAEVEQDGHVWRIRKVTLSRSARRLMEGVAFVPMRTVMLPSQNATAVQP